jgi:citrate/tricarballylate utilization protein
VGGERITMADITASIKAAGTMKNLTGGHGEGCNFENGERFTSTRRWAHQAVMYGFLLCFASTSAGTVLHYVFDMPAPYPLWSLPKLLGIPGGVLLTLGCIWLVALKQKSDPTLTDQTAETGSSAFVALLGFVGLSGLALYALGATALMPTLLALHLGAVLAFFLLTPFSKMAHGFFRFAALIRDEQERR